MREFMIFCYIILFFFFIFNVCQIVYYAYLLHKAKVKCKKARQEIYEKYKVWIEYPPAF